MYVGGRRFFIKSKFRFTIFLSLIFLIILILCHMIFYDNKVEGYENSRIKIIVVSKGDTLWDIVKHHNPKEDFDIRELIFHVKKINNLNSSYVFPGQELLVPIRE